jgi:hypothetical protein
MAFLRRLLGGGTTDEPDAEPPASPAEIEAAERAHELEVLQAEQERLDELSQRQLRYARFAWQPPAQGGDRRADDPDASDSGADASGDERT